MPCYGALLAGFFDFEIDFVFFRRFFGRLFGLLSPFFFLGVLPCALLRFLQPPPDFVERGDLIRLLLHVEVVDPFFLQIDDPSRRVPNLDLAAALDGVCDLDSFPRRLTAEHTRDPAQHAFELQLCFIPRFHLR